ncbi:MAG: hypothetical protein K8W52_27290 [Deltaproteobacteria bacterium]|nr:hypothetical protein [Deltaproteobacteria bacterium]
MMGLLALVAGCGGGGSAGLDATVAVDARGIDAAVDAAQSIDANADAPTDAGPPSALSVIDGTAVITSWSPPASYAGQRASVTLFIQNDGAADIPTLSLTGVTDFTIDALASTCDDGVALATGDLCQAVLAFAPSGAGTGARDADLRLAIGGGASLDFPLHGVALGPPPDLHADVSGLDLGVLALDDLGQGSVLLSNTGASNVTLGAIAASGGFAVDASACPAIVTPGGACTLTIRFKATSLGLATGTLTVASSANAVAVGLSAIGMRRITVTTIGSGSVTSSPSGIACGATCAGLFLGAVTLTATADPGATFAGWSGSCGTAVTCALPAGGSLPITATFDDLATSKRIDVVFAGAGTTVGRVQIVDTTANTRVTCDASCTSYVPTGDDVVLVGYTPSTFAGWSGACVSAAGECALGTIVSDRVATATFDRDDREVAAFFPTVPAELVAYTPGGDLIVAGAGAVSELTPGGAVVWSTVVAASGARDLAVDAAGNIYFLGDALYRLSPAGAVVWAHPVDGIEIAVAPIGDIAVNTAAGTVVLDPAGQPRWTVPGVAAPITFTSDGVLVVGVDDGMASGYILTRYDGDGAPLADLGTIDNYRHVLAGDQVGAVVAQSSGFSHTVVSRITSTGEVTISNYETISAAGSIAVFIAVDAANDVVTGRPLVDAPLGGLRLRVFSPTGAIMWTHEKAGDPPPSGHLLDDAVAPTGLATDAFGHVAVVGTYGYAQPWVQIYAMP